MNKHLDDGQLRTAIDRGLDANARRHLEDCAACQMRLERLEKQVAESAQKLDFLAPREMDAAPAPAIALKYLYNRKLPQKETPMLKKILASTAVRFVAVAALALTLIVSIPATRALADQVLNLLRVQQVTVIPVDFTGLQQLTGNDTALGKQFTQLISDSVDMTQKPGDPVNAADAADASQKAGFNVRLPGNADYSRLTVTDAAAFNFTVDRTKAQALLDESGRSDLVLPASIDGAVISVDIPASVRADYGTCPDPTSEDIPAGGTPGRNYPNCMILAEIPSPTVNAPADVNVAQLAQIGLEFTGMTPEQARAFTDSVDWTSTLVIPIPKNAATYQQLTVDGVTGTLIQRPADDAPQFALTWIKNGIIYSIGGLGTNSQRAIDMANSMP